MRHQRAATDHVVSHICNYINRINSPGIGGTRRSDDQPGPQTCSLVLRGSAPQAGYVHPETDHPLAPGAFALSQACSAYRLVHAMMGIRCQCKYNCFQYPVHGHPWFPGQHNGRQVRDTAPGSQITTGRCGISNQAGHPLDQLSAPFARHREMQMTHRNSNWLRQQESHPRQMDRSRHRVYSPYGHRKPG